MIYLVSPAGTTATVDHEQAARDLEVLGFIRVAEVEEESANGESPSDDPRGLLREHR